MKRLKHIGGAIDTMQKIKSNKGKNFKVERNTFTNKKVRWKKGQKKAVVGQKPTGKTTD